MVRGYRWAGRNRKYAADMTAARLAHVPPVLVPAHFLAPYPPVLVSPVLVPPVLAPQPPGVKRNSGRARMVELHGAPVLERCRARMRTLKAKKDADAAHIMQALQASDHQVVQALAGLHDVIVRRYLAMHPPSA